MFPGRFITMWTSGGWLPTPREVFGTGAIVRWHRSHQFDHRPRRRVTSCSFSRSSAETENPQTVSKRWVLPAPFLCFARSFLWPQKPFCCGVFWSFSAWQPVKTTSAGRKRLERTDWAEDEKQSSSVLSERRLVSSPSTCFCAHLQCVSVCVCVNNNQLLTITQLSDRNAHRFTFSFVFRWAYVLLGSVSLLIVSVAVSTTPTLLFSVVNYLCKQM